MKRLVSLKAFLTFVLALVFCMPAFADKVYDTDYVIVGGGATGLSSAVQAQLLGVKNVVVLEKQAITGGTGNFAEGLFAAESSVQLRQGIDVSKEFAFKTIMDYSHWRANAPLVTAFVNKSADTIEWLKQFGIKYEYVGVGGFGGPLTWHVIDWVDVDGKQYHHGEAVMKVLTKRFVDNGGTLLLNTGAKDLIKKNGKIVGVVAETKDGEKVTVNAKAVLVSSGGFANNKEMVAKWSRYPNMIFIGQIGKMGDGINMAWKAGAAEEGAAVMQSYRPGLAGFHPASHMIAAAVQPYLFVDTKGHRYTDESNITEWPQSGNALERIGGTAYSIYDEDTRQMVLNEGIQMPLGEWVLHGTKLEKLDAEFNKELAKKNGNVFKCNTIEEVAKAIGADSKVLKATVAEINKAADMHKDDLFHKDPKYLRHVAKAPFYVTKLNPRALGTLGGIKINEKTEVVDVDGEIIPGLYAGGLDAGGMYGDSYDLKLGGGTFGFAINSGRIAAENAANYLGIK